MRKMIVSPHQIDITRQLLWEGGIPKKVSECIRDYVTSPPPPINVACDFATLCMLWTHTYDRLLMYTLSKHCYKKQENYLLNTNGSS